MTSRLLDISPPLSPATAVWPGDVPLEWIARASLAGDGPTSASGIRTTLHVGSHADAPSHLAPTGRAIDEQPLDLYYGPCEVVRISIAPRERVRPEHLPDHALPARVLIRTDSYGDRGTWSPDFVGLSPELIDHLADRGGRLVGIDTPSVDPYADEALRAHRAAGRRDVAILEGLVLSAAPAGRYTLIALPLRLAGADGSPVRAALLPG